MLPSLLNNRYQILSSLARGGFGETFLAVDTHLPSSKKCVIKQLKPLRETAELPAWLKERFQKEATILEKLGNNNSQIPKLYAYFCEEENFYLVQEWIEGMTLTQKWQLDGNFTEEEVKDLLINILPVLDYIHSRQIIHRDIKPDNIIIRKSDSQPVLIDFGIIKEKVGTQLNGQNNSSVILGTPGYMASEQATGRPVYSSDLYSLGLTAVFLLSGKNAEEFPSDHHTGEILWRESLNNPHSQLIMVLERVIRFHPRDRISSAKEMLAALKNIPSQSPTKAITFTNTQTNSLELNTQQNNGLGIWSWLFMMTISAAAFGLGFFLIGLQSRFSNNRPISQPSVLPSVVDFSPRPLLTPSVKVIPSPNVTPPQRTPSPEISITPLETPIPSETPTPLETLIPLETPTPLETPIPLETPTPSETPTPLETPIPDKTPTPELSPSPSPEKLPESP